MLPQLSETMKLSKSDALFERANALVRAKKFLGAERILRAAVKNGTKTAKVLHLLGLVLFEQRKLKHAEAFLGRAVKTDNYPLDAILLLAEIQSENGFLGESIMTLEIAKKRFPKNAEILKRMASKQRALGKSEEAEASYLAALGLEPENPYIYLDYLVNDGTPVPQINAAMTEIFEKGAARPVDRATAGYCLFRVEERRGSDPGSINILVKSSSLFRSSYSYDSRNEIENILSIREHFTQEFRQGVDQQGYTGGNHIFVVGMPRSGTSLAERILASHTNVKGFGELGLIRRLAREHAVNQDGALSLKRLTGDHLKDLGTEYSKSVLQGLPDTTVTVDKMPHNFMWVGFIKAILPNAKVVHCKRSRMDTCFSLYKSLFAVGLHKYSYNQQELANYYQAYTQIMAHWEAQFGDEVFELKYESLIDNPHEIVARILSHCGLEWEDSCLAFYKTKSEVKTLSSSQVSKPLYRSSINSWQKYGDGLKVLQQSPAS